MKNRKEEYERCVCCNKLLDINKKTPINYRLYYIEGAGQLCHSCYKKIYKK